MKFVIEPIETNKPRSWGDMDPATKEMSSYNAKSKGGIKLSESEITEENGYKNIVVLGPGVSPAKYIAEREKLLNGKLA